MQTFKAAFRERNLPINADYRPIYKIGLIIMTLHLACRGGKSSLSKLHFLIWALKSEKNMALIRLVLASRNIDRVISWGVEPALNMALQYAQAEELVSLTNDRYYLTERGSSLAKSIAKHSDLFLREKPFLNYIGKQKVTEDYINTLTEKLTHS